MWRRTRQFYSLPALKGAKLKCHILSYQALRVTHKGKMGKCWAKGERMWKVRHCASGPHSTSGPGWPWPSPFDFWTPEVLELYNRESILENFKMSVTGLKSSQTKHSCLEKTGTNQFPALWQRSHCPVSSLYILGTLSHPLGNHPSASLLLSSEGCVSSVFSALGFTAPLTILHVSVTQTACLSGWDSLETTVQPQCSLLSIIL